jgi:Cohesin domain
MTSRHSLGDLAWLFRGRFYWALPLFLLPLSALFGQKLQLSSVAASPGERASIEISFNSAPGEEVSALQWETTIPSAQLNFLDETAAPGPAAQAANKSVNCALKNTKSGGTLTSVCILSGGQEPIHNGVIATLLLKVLPETAAGSVRIHVDQALAVSKDLKRFPVDPVETTITIRPK